jgi:hypothetical protein
MSSKKEVYLVILAAIVAAAGYSFGCGHSTHASSTLLNSTVRLRFDGGHPPPPPSPPGPSTVTLNPTAGL